MGKKDNNSTIMLIAYFGMGISLLFFIPLLFAGDVSEMSDTPISTFDFVVVVLWITTYIGGSLLFMIDVIMRVVKKFK